MNLTTTIAKKLNEFCEAQDAYEATPLAEANNKWRKAFRRTLKLRAKLALAQADEERLHLERRQLAAEHPEWEALQARSAKLSSEVADLRRQAEAADQHLQAAA